MKKSYIVRPIGVVKSTRSKISDDHWNREKTRIVVNAEIPADTLTGIEQYSHLEIIYLLDRVKPDEICWGARHPRGNPKYAKYGIFAQRARVRPNRIGSTIVKLTGRTGRTLQIKGLDAIDGTPVLDIKPVFREFLPKGKTRQPAWVAELMTEYW
jgi:tRNA-Thr(GGU) m(6)t(6)A37 methyltransferase TsaA